MAGRREIYPATGSSVSVQSVLRDLAAQAGATTDISGTMCGDASASGTKNSPSYEIRVQCFEVKSTWSRVKAWKAGTHYVVGDVRSMGGYAYKCLVAHFSGVFEADLNATPPKWMGVGGPTQGQSWAADAKSVMYWRTYNSLAEQDKVYWSSGQVTRDLNVIWVSTGTAVDTSEDDSGPGYSIGDWVWCIWDYQAHVWRVLTGGGGGGTPGDVYRDNVQACQLTTGGYAAPNTWTLKISATSYGFTACDGIPIYGDVYSQGTGSGMSLYSITSVVTHDGATVFYAALVDTPAWATATAYAVNASVSAGMNLYRCLVAHTSGVFNNDLTANPPKWILLNDDDPTTTGTLTRVSGTGASTINYTAYTKKTFPVSGEFPMVAGEDFMPFSGLNAFWKYWCWFHELDTPFVDNGITYGYLNLNVGYFSQTFPDLGITEIMFYFVEVNLATIKGAKPDLEDSNTWVYGPLFYRDYNASPRTIYHSWLLVNSGAYHCINVPHEAIETDENGNRVAGQLGPNPSSPAILFGLVNLGSGGGSSGGGSGGETYWDRGAATLTPKTSGDSVNLGSGTMTASFYWYT